MTGFILDRRRDPRTPRREARPGHGPERFPTEARKRLWAGALCLCLILPVARRPASAELVVFSSGHVLKVAELRIEGNSMELVLDVRGRLTVPLTVVERVVDDEIVLDAEPLPSRHPPVAFSDTATEPQTPFGNLIFEAARRYSLNPDLVAAMVRAESAFDPSAVSHKGARGLMQLMPATALRFGVSPDALFDPGQNLEAGVAYLEWLSRRYPDAPALMLAAYNAGEGNVDRYGGVPPFRETREYIRRVYSSLGLEADEALTATR